MSTQGNIRPPRLQRAVHSLVILILGIVVPVLVLGQAYSNLSRLSDFVGSSAEGTAPIVQYTSIKNSLKTPDDYTIFSLLSAEHTNNSVIINKQVMKISIMQIGFSVISLGMMLVILGINDGGGDGQIGIGELRFDFKTGSTGVLVFVVGAAMATIGGVIKNDYSTVPIPTYGSLNRDLASDNLTADLFWEECKQQAGGKYKECFANTYESYKNEEMK